MHRRDFLKGATLLSVGTLSFLKSVPVLAAGSDTAVVVSGTSINSLDIHRPGTNRASYQVAVNCYDRLLTFGTKKLPNGSLSYDYDNLQPELAASWQVSDDRRTLTFKLRKGATFWDGSPVTAHDVKWSFDRAVSLGGFPAAQMGAGSMEKPDQFEAVDDETFRVHLPHGSKLSLPDLTTPVAIVINSKAAKAHATKSDPWATDYLHLHPAGSGAFKVARWDPGQQLVYERYDHWSAGPEPQLRRVIVREIPSQSTRRALITRGDAQISMDIPDRDAKELSDSGKLKVISTPIENCLTVLCPNLDFKPFQDKKVRQALAYAMPYEAIFENAAYGRGVPMWGAKSEKPDSIAWPQPFPYRQDMDKAKDLLAQTPYAKGFEVPFSFNLNDADWAQPTALLIQEALSKLGIRTTINKIPGANWRTVALIKKSLPLHLQNFGGWLNTPDYYFYWAYVKGKLFNSSNYDNPEITRLVNETLFMKQSNPEYAPKVRRMIEIAIQDVPRIPLYQPTLNVAMQPDVSGYVYWYHRQLDVRPLKIT